MCDMRGYTQYDAGQLRIFCGMSLDWSKEVTAHAKSNASGAY